MQHSLQTITLHSSGRAASPRTPAKPNHVVSAGGWETTQGILAWSQFPQKELWSLSENFAFDTGKAVSNCNREWNEYICLSRTITRATAWNRGWGEMRCDVWQEVPERDWGLNPTRALRGCCCLQLRLGTLSWEKQGRLWIQDAYWVTEMKTLHEQLEYSNELRSEILGREMNVGITDIRSLHLEN